MDKTNLIFIILSLVVVLAFLLFLLFKPKQNKREVKVKKSSSVSFDDLLMVLKNTASSTQELGECVDTILKDYREIDDFSGYEKAIVYLCKHPNTNKRLIIRLDTTLEKYNPSFKTKIASALKMGLDSRT